MIQALILFVVYLIILGVVVWLLRYIVNAIPWIDAAFKTVILIAITVISVLVALVLFMNLVLPMLGVHSPLPSG